MSVFALDTSNYTTSAAVFDGERGTPSGRLLPVEEGALGLRQSDALFHHVRRLPAIVEALKEAGELSHVQAVGASTRPRAVEGSYMPCFLAGECVGRVLAQVLDVPFAAVSHQQGHIAAAAWSAGQMELLDQNCLVWHLSGGTTELLLAQPDGVNVKTTILGGTTDISAGQLIDRTGLMLSIPFPAGKGIDALSQEAEKDLNFPVKVHDCRFSLSGMENKAHQLLDSGADRAMIARFVLNVVYAAVKRATIQAREKYPGLPVLLSGGVASNSLLRRQLDALEGVYYAQPQYSTDNAMGVAILTWRMLKAGML